MNSCPLFGRVSDVESTLGLDFELATLVRGLMLKVCDGSSVPGAYDLSDIFKAREESSLKCMSLKDCGFIKTLACVSWTWWTEFGFSILRRMQTSVN